MSQITPEVVRNLRERLREALARSRQPLLEQRGLTLDDVAPTHRNHFPSVNLRPAAEAKEEEEEEEDSDDDASSDDRAIEAMLLANRLSSSVALANPPAARNARSDLANDNDATALPASGVPPPLPPSVEAAYRRKCIELRRRMAEVERHNDEMRLLRARRLRSIRKLRLERALLLEHLGKRMKKNDKNPHGLATVFDEDSEGSSDGPPTPREKPLRSKRSHRRHPASPPPNPDEAATPQSSFLHENPKFQAYRPTSTGKTGDRHYTPSNARGGSPDHHNGTAGIDRPGSSSYLASSPPPASSTTRGQPHPMVPIIPPADAITMYAEDRYLSNPSKYPEAADERSLLKLARENWENESAGTQELFKLRASKAQDAYEVRMKRAEEYDNEARTEDRGRKTRSTRVSAAAAAAAHAAAEADESMEGVEYDEDDDAGEDKVQGFTSING